MQISKYSIAAAKFDYEFLGKSAEEIASQYGFNLEAVYGEIENAGWTRKIEPQAMPQTDNIQEFADQLERITRSKLSIISLFRQIDNQALYAQLEKAVLEKALEAVAALDSVDDRVANKLVNITKTLASIQERNPIQLADQLKDAASADASVVVNIANQVQ